MTVPEWRTISVAKAPSHWLNAYHDDGRLRVTKVAVVLLQESIFEPYSMGSPEARRTRAVFADVVSGGELVPACDLPGYVGPMSEWAYLADGVDVTTRTLERNHKNV